MFRIEINDQINEEVIIHHANMRNMQIIIALFLLYTYIYLCIYIGVYAYTNIDTYMYVYI